MPPVTSQATNALANRELIHDGSSGTEALLSSSSMPQVNCNDPEPHPCHKSTGTIQNMLEYLILLSFKRLNFV
ncbi:hypothetical protein SLA2020_279170 [Shorea laevis]